MRSPVELPSPRIALEWALRGAALAALATILAHTFADARRAAPARVLSPEALLTSRDSTVPGDTLRLGLSDAPSPAARDLLAALVRAGRIVTWADAGVPALAASAEPPRAPGAAPTLLVSAPAAYDLTLGDTAGALDSLRTTGAAIALPVAGDGRTLRARARATVARVAVRESLDVRRVLVLGRVGWEAKFTIAALEEAGWGVDADLTLAPGLGVVQADGVARAAGTTPDTARHGAVIVLDSAGLSPARAAAVARFVRAGGGAVLAGEGALAFARLRTGGAGPRIPGEAGALAATEPRRGLPLRPVAPGADAVVLERRGAMVAAAARRVGAGRVVQIGYEDSWRWRMEGDEDAPGAHRRWWSAVVASVARAPVAARLDTAWAPGAHDAAPRAALVAAIGAAGPSVERREPPERGPRLPDSLLLAAALLALLGEWASRRLRGAR